jgi:hypothetical protein
MAEAKRINITTPVGRLVGGSLYDPETKDFEGKPLTMKDKVTPRVDYQFGIAIPKSPGVQHWASETWGAPIWALGHQAFPSEAQRPDFAWKIQDGDSTIPNKRGRKNVDREGYPGHWIMWFTGGYAPQIWNADGSQQILERDAVKPGYYIQVFGNIGPNTGASAGLYINHSMVALTAYGPEIRVGPDVSAAGFGQGVALPPGASATPPAANFNPAPPPVVGAPPVYPPVAGAAAPYAPPTNSVSASAPPVTTFPSSPPVAPPPTVAVAPNPGILMPPVGDPRNAKLTGTGGATYEALIAGGWTDALLIAHGHMLP